jgi:hypothetical protein
MKKRNQHIKDIMLYKNRKIICSYMKIAVKLKIKITYEI